MILRPAEVRVRVTAEDNLFTALEVTARDSCWREFLQSPRNPGGSLLEGKERGEIFATHLGPGPPDQGGQSIGRVGIPSFTPFIC